MTHIEQLIQDLCPNGVEFKTLGDLGVFENTGVDKKSRDDEQEVTLLNFMDVCRHKYIDASIPSMVVTAPDRKIEQCNVLKDDIFITPSSETIDEIGFAAVIMEDLPNVVYSYHIMRYRLKQPNTTTAKFIRYLFEAPVVRKQILKGAKGLTRFGLSKYQFAAIEIPLPPIEIQQKIVECLDKFSALAAELQVGLQEEYQMRRKQYEHYRTQLLTPHSDNNSADKTDGRNWEWKTLGEIATFSQGIQVNVNGQHDSSKDGYVRFLRIVDYTKDNEPPRYIEFPGERYIVNESDIVMIRYGAAGKVVRGYNGAIANNLFKVTFNENLVNKDFAFYYLAQNKIYQKLNGASSSTTMPAVNFSTVKQLAFPLPSLTEQARIVAILDKFESLTTSLSDGIPAEQAAQQKRYEYYRDLLLTFDRKAE